MILGEQCSISLGYQNADGNTFNDNQINSLMQIDCAMLLTKFAQSKVCPSNNAVVPDVVNETPGQAVTAEGHDHDLNAAEYYSCSISKADQICTRTLQLSGKQLIEDQVEAQSTRQDQEDVFLL